MFIPAKDVDHLAEHVLKHVGRCYPLRIIHRLLVSCWQHNGLNNVLDISGAVQRYVHKRLVLHAWRQVLKLCVVCEYTMYDAGLHVKVTQILLA